MYCGLVEQSSWWGEIANPDDGRWLRLGHRSGLPQWKRIWFGTGRSCRIRLWLQLVPLTTVSNWIVALNGWLLRWQWIHFGNLAKALKSAHTHTLHDTSSASFTSICRWELFGYQCVVYCAAQLCFYSFADKFQKATSKYSLKKTAVRFVFMCSSKWSCLSCCTKVWGRPCRPAATRGPSDTICAMTQGYRDPVFSQDHSKGSGERLSGCERNVGWTFHDQNRWVLKTGAAEHEPPSLWGPGVSSVLKERREGWWRGEEEKAVSSREWNPKQKRNMNKSPVSSDETTCWTEAQSQQVACRQASNLTDRAEAELVHKLM